MILPEYQGRGFASEAASLVEYAFSELAVERLVRLHGHRERRLCGVAEKLEMTYQGSAEKELNEARRYSLAKSRFFEIRGKRAN